MSDKTLDQVAADFKALRPEERRAVSEMVKRLGDISRDTPDLSIAERRVLLVEVAREVGNAHLIAAAEKVVGQH